MKEKMRKDSLGSDTSSNADKKLQNQFSFVERATQTMNNSLKVQKNINFLIEIEAKFHQLNRKVRTDCSFDFVFNAHKLFSYLIIGCALRCFDFINHASKKRRYKNVTNLNK